MAFSLPPDLEVAVVLPCYNEAVTIGTVVRDFRLVLPTARIIVFDNDSTDSTAEVAKSAGAEVIHVSRRGKGNVVRSMFAEVDADVYVMADGDGTYPASEAPRLIHELLKRRLDMVIGAREHIREDAGRAGHALGNRVFNWLFSRMFKPGFTDIFSGYRAFSRRFVRSFPAISTGFEIETELAVHAQILLLPVAEIAVSYGRRPEGSASKLSTFRDGARIFSILLLLMKEVKPFVFFNYVCLATLLISFAFMGPVLKSYFETGLVERLPTWISGLALMLLAFLFFICGVILDSVARGRLENKRLAALAIPRFEPAESGIRAPGASPRFKFTKPATQLSDGV